REASRETLEFSGMQGVVFNGIPAMEAVHFEEATDGEAGEARDKSVTLLKINTEVPQDLSASLAIAIVDLLAERAEALERVVVAAAVQPPKRNNAATRADVIPPDRVCAFTSAGFNSAVDEILSPPTGVAVLPASARIADSFLTTLIRLCRLEEVPLLVLARVGYRATGNRADVDGTDEAIADLGLCLARTVGLEFDAKKACGLSWSKGWKGTRPSQGIVPGYI
ncbi:unnamed protein product, partial [Sphacelaria rigidula]